MSKLKFNKEQFKSIIKWSKTPWINGLTYKKNDAVIDETEKINKDWWKKLKEKEALREREWGNKLINMINNGNWTTKVGEGIVHDILIKKGKNPKRY
ncbi:MAG: hypothetical protein CXT73_07375 [Methanobacteriota archaeon]|nr:MAG: hypothetical protein CXT73_07375 [Euryarchaeota archaeon]